MNKAKAFKTSDYLKSNEDRAEYLKAVMAENDEGLLMLSIREIIDSMGGMGKVAKETGLARESLYRSFSEKGNPTYKTLFKVLDNIGLQLSVSVK
jgi:probable addiction module antidote protein